MSKTSGITGRKLLNFLSKLSPKELAKPVIFISDEFSLSLPISSVKKQPYALLTDGSDDPAPLKSRSGWIGEYDAEEVDTFDVEIEKGDIVITH